MISFTLDGKRVQAEEGETILDVAQRANITIPTLCNHKGLDPAGLCRLCTVELFDGRRTRFVTACNYPVWEGMVVRTDTEEVQLHRRTIVELLFARCPNNDFVRELAAQYDVGEPRFKLEDENCILCGLCVRVCAERMGSAAISFTGRGAQLDVDTPFHLNTEDCLVCGACETVCPTGRIDLREIATREPRPLLSEWNEGLAGRSAVYISFPQAIPLVPVIDPEACVHLNTGNCGICRDTCTAGAIDFSQEEEIIELEVGSIILATGYHLMDPTPIKQYGYGRYPNVLTSLEFERLTNATGPTGGQILMRDGNSGFSEPPASVGIVHCVGSRDVNHHEYCSRVCCMYALKYGHLLRERLGEEAEIYNFYIDMRCFGKGYEEFFKRIQEEGITFIRGKPAEVTDYAASPKEEGKLVLIGEDTLLAKPYRIPVDMVILCPAIEPQKDSLDVARVFGVNMSADGFFLEEHPKLGPISTAADGVFIAGCCQGPKDIPDTVAQAMGAAAEALALAAKGVVEIAPVTSYIDPDICSGCRTCFGLCPYSAIEFDERRGVSVVNEALCKGCGSCAGHCPSGAAQVNHFNSRQVFAEIDGMLDEVV